MTVAGYIGAAYFFTSTSFANLAVTVAREFTDTFAEIAPTSVVSYLLARVASAALGAGTVQLLYPHVSDAAKHAVVPHDGDRQTPARQ